MDITRYVSPLALTALCSEIHMPDEVTERVTKIASQLDCMALEEFFEGLFSVDTGQIAEAKIHDATADESGLTELSILLAAANHTRELYDLRGITNNIFIDTMGCFTRFVNECHRWTGNWCFDRGFWVWHQLCGSLYRLGTLEFEVCSLPEELEQALGICAGQKIIQVHIPSDAVCTKSALHDAYVQAETFFTKQLGAMLPVYCRTWLLSPTLKELLNESSGILTFQRDYTLIKTYPEDTSYRLWLYGKGDFTTADLPETTSLQRKVKAHLLSGGCIGSGLGKLAL